MAEMASGRIGIGKNMIIVALHTKQAPSEAEWNEYLEHSKVAMSVADMQSVSGFTITDGGAPSATMRKRLAAIIDSKRARGAIITDQGLVRGVVTALSWINPQIRAFSPERINEALLHMYVTPEQSAPLWELVENLRKHLPALHTYDAIRR